MSGAAGRSRTPVQVLIAGDKYNLRTDADEEYTLRCAALVDERMRAIGGVSGMDKTKTAIMAALSLSDELLQQQASFQSRVAALTGRIEDELAAGDESPGSQGEQPGG